MRAHRGALASGIFFILAGVAFLLDSLEVWTLRPAQLWPMLIIGLGVALVIGGLGDRETAEE